MVGKTLLLCGVAASALYVGMTILVAMRWDSYSSWSQTVSELSAIGAPTRALWVPLGLGYTALMACFGCGVWAAGAKNPRLRIAGGFLVAYGFIGLFWPPMHLREVLAAGGKTLTDTMHLVFATATVLLMLIAMGFSAASFGKRFRVYTIVSIVVLFVFGLLTSIDAPRVQANLPTPWVGVWERMDIAVFLIWVVVLATTLLTARAEVGFMPS